MYFDDEDYYYPFTLESLKDYTFTQDNSLFWGHDKQGRVWEEPELTEMQKKGLIFICSPHKTVFFKEGDRSLLGYIQEGFDGTWLAHSGYYPPMMDGMEVFGFINEFYAVRFLLQVMQSQSEYSDSSREIPQISWKIPINYTYYPQNQSVEYHTFSRKYLENYTFTLHEELSCGYDREGCAYEESEFTKMQTKGLIVKECSYKSVYFERILLGYIQECFDGTWLAHSPYEFLIKESREVFGFLDEFYAVRFLHQVIKAQYFEEIGDAPDLPWGE